MQCQRIADVRILWSSIGRSNWLTCSYSVWHLKESKSFSSSPVLLIARSLLGSVLAFRGSKRFVIVKNIINLGKTKDYRMHKQTGSASTHTYAHPVNTQYYMLITNRLYWLTKQWNFAILLCNRDCLWHLYALGEKNVHSLSYYHQ